jgi:hypothetical protein
MKSLSNFKVQPNFIPIWQFKLWKFDSVYSPEEIGATMPLRPHLAGPLKLGAGSPNLEQENGE